MKEVFEMNKMKEESDLWHYYVRQAILTPFVRNVPLPNRAPCCCYCSSVYFPIPLLPQNPQHYHHQQQVQGGDGKFLRHALFSFISIEKSPTMHAQRGANVIHQSIMVLIRMSKLQQMVLHILVLST